LLVLRLRVFALRVGAFKQVARQQVKGRSEFFHFPTSDLLDELANLQLATSQLINPPHSSFVKRKSHLQLEDARARSVDSLSPVAPAGKTGASATCFRYPSALVCSAFRKNRWG
jgi:hypothetical protein